MKKVVNEMLKLMRKQIDNLKPVMNGKNMTKARYNKMTKIEDEFRKLFIENYSELQEFLFDGESAFTNYSKYSNYEEFIKANKNTLFKETANMSKLLYSTFDTRNYNTSAEVMSWFMSGFYTVLFDYLRFSEDDFNKCKESIEALINFTSESAFIMNS